MVDAPFIQCAGTDRVNTFLITDIVVVHVSIELCFCIESTEVEDMFVIGFENKSIAGGEQIVVEENQ